MFPLSLELAADAKALEFLQEGGYSSVGLLSLIEKLQIAEAMASAKSKRDHDIGVRLEALGRQLGKER